MPQGSIPHGQQRPDVVNRHASNSNNSGASAQTAADLAYESEMAAQFEPAFGVVPGRAYGDLRLTAFQFRVFALMCGYANRKDRICWPKQETLAKILHTSAKVISKIVVQLQKLGYVEIAKSGYPARNVYRIIWDEPLNKPLAAYLPATESTPQWSQPSDSTPQGGQTPLPRGVRLHSPVESYNRPLEQTNASSLRILREDVGDGEETRVNARDPLAEKILRAGAFPRQTNRAALAQLIACHPQLSDGEWEFQAAAAAEWFTDHERRLTLASYASWISRYEREQRQLAEEEIRQESHNERPTQHRPASRTGRRPSGGHASQRREQRPEQRREPTPLDLLDEALTFEPEDDRILRILREERAKSRCEAGGDQRPAGS
jgi:hypothetical protein